MEDPAGLTGGKESDDTDFPDVSQSIPVHITVVKVQDLKNLKSSVLVSLVRVEYNGVFLGESPKTDVLPDGTAEYDFSTSFECSRNGPHTVDVVVHKPLLLTVLEVGQKDKKKQEKIIPLGQAVVDLLPLAQGECTLKISTPVYAVGASSSERLRPEAMAVIEVTVSSKDVLLSATEFWTGSLLCVTLEAAYSVPEGFTTEAQQSYMACLQIPTADNELVVLFKNGILKADGEKEPYPRPKKWPLGGIVAPAAQAIPSSFIVGGPYEEEDGELTKSEDREFRIQAESKKKIVWDMERRCFLDIVSVAVLQRRIAQCRYWPVELCRMTVVSAGKGKASKVEKGDEDKQVPFHGVAYVDMGPLLCPGVKQIRGAYRVYTYQDNEVFAKTKTQHSIFRDRRSELSLIKEGMASSPVSKAAPSKAQKEEKGSSNLLSDGTGGSENVTDLSLEGQQYNEAGTFLIIEITLDKPLVPKRQREELAQRVKDIIPPHATLPGRTDGAEKAVEDYHKRVTSVALSILSEYHDLFGKDLPDKGAIDHKILEEQKRQLSYELNISGKYFAFKEQLKYSVVKIVREKYLKTTAFESKEELQTFLCELYVYLMDHMHIALNKLLSEEDVSSAPPSLTTSKQLGLFAREAEADKNFDLACLFHKQRIAQDQHNVQSWLDYGAFCLLHETTTKAQECFQQALRLDPEHVQSLLLCGIMAVMLQHCEEAEIFFEDACCLDPSSIIAWTLSGLFYELQNNYIRAERNFREAKKLLRTQLEEERRMLEAAEAEEGKKPSFPYTDPEERLPEKTLDDSADQQPEVVEGVTSKEEALLEDQEAPCIASGPQRAPCTIFMKTLEFLMEVNAVRFVHMALAHEMLSLQGGPTCAYYLALAWTYSVQNDLVRCEECLHEAIRVDPLNPNVWAQKGHLCYLRKDFKKAKDYYERVISFVEDASDMHFVYLRLGSIYLEEKQYARAKHIYLLACDDSPSCLTWLGVGIACYRMGQMVEAEDALSEANTLNNTHAEVWAYLALVSLNGGRQLEAEQCYKYTLKLGLQNDELLKEIRALQHHFGFGDPSF